MFTWLLAGYSLGSVRTLYDHRSFILPGEYNALVTLCSFSPSMGFRVMHNCSLTRNYFRWYNITYEVVEEEQNSSSNLIKVKYSVSGQNYAELALRVIRWFVVRRLMLRYYTPPLLSRFPIIRLYCYSFPSSFYSNLFGQSWIGLPVNVPGSGCHGSTPRVLVASLDQTLTEDLLPFLVLHLSLVFMMLH